MGFKVSGFRGVCLGRDGFGVGEFGCAKFLSSGCLCEDDIGGDLGGAGVVAISFPE